jgi:uncharacterized protein YjdB
MLLFTMVFCITAAPVYASAGPTDISGHWAQSQIEKAYAQGLVIGYPDGTFKPDQNVSRAEFVTMVNNAFGFKAETSTYFTDVKDTDWFAGQISRAKAAGYISGYEDGSFKPDNYISRQEVASIMSRIIKTSNPAGIDLLSRFIDAEAISSWAQGAVASVIASGTMQGYPDQTFKPQNFITRAEAVVVLNQAIGIEPQPVTQSITSITVTGAGDANTVKKGSTLQMSAAVLPANATDKSVTWSLTNGTGTATIAEAGLLTGTGLGTVTVKATANDGSGVSGTEQITVTAATSSGGGGGSGNGGDDSDTVSVSEITYADVAITSGSVIFGYTFKDGNVPVTYEKAKDAPYYLNEDESTVTLMNGEDLSVEASVYDLDIQDNGTVEYQDFEEILLDFAGLDFVPTQIQIYLVGASSVNSGHDRWTKEVTVDLTDAEIALFTPPAIATVSSDVYGLDNPSVTVTGTGASFKAGITTSDLTVDEGATTLTFVSVTRVSATQITVGFTGTAAAGNVTIQTETSAYDPAPSLASNTLTVTVSP